MPVDEIVPALASDGSISQLTSEFADPSTSAVNSCACPGFSVTEGGSTLTVRRVGSVAFVGLNFSTRFRIISRIGSDANPLPNPNTTDNIGLAGLTT